MRVSVLNVPFDDVTLEEAVGRALALLEQETPSYVVTPNAEIVNWCRHDAEAARAIGGADLILPDGIGVVQASRKLGHPLPERVAGIDFAAGLLEALSRTGKRVFLLGAKPGVAEKAARNLTERLPGLTICGTRDGYFTDEEAVLENIRESRADVLFVCLGAPRQELFIRKHLHQTGARLHVGLGGSLDVWSGEVKRAPKLWIQLNLEWLYRLLANPSRFFRVLKLFAFRRAVAREARRVRRSEK